MLDIALLLPGRANDLLGFVAFEAEGGGDGARGGDDVGDEGGGGGGFFLRTKCVMSIGSEEEDVGGFGGVFTLFRPG